MQDFSWSNQYPVSIGQPGLDSDGRRFFQGQDQFHATPDMGMDSLEGVQVQAADGTLSNEEVWLQDEDSFDFDIAGSYPSGSELQPGTSVSAQGWLTDGDNA